MAFECTARGHEWGKVAERVSRCAERTDGAWRGNAYEVVRRAGHSCQFEPASRSAELGEVGLGRAPRMRMLGGTAHRDGRQTAADTRREVARLRQCCRVSVLLPFSRARWRASVIAAAAAAATVSRSHPGNGGEPRYARSSQLVDSHPVVVVAAVASARQRTRRRPYHPYRRIVNPRRGRSCFAPTAPVDT